MSSQSGAKHDEQKRARVSQSEFPNNTLTQALRIAHAIFDNFAGTGGQPHAVAMALDLVPTSGSWRNLCGSSIAYGLTEGGYNANEITLTDLGRRVVAPLTEGDDAAAKIAAILQPRVMREFFRKYDKAKFPKDEIARNVLVALGLPKERSEAALAIVKENGRLTGVILETKTGPFISLSGGVFLKGSSSPAPTVPAPEYDAAAGETDRMAGHKDNDAPAATLHSPPLPKPAGNRVFISHGKNSKILEQVKEIVRFGKFEPVIAQENESVSKPVPQKVLDDMRTCQAGVIHIGSEGTLLDEKGQQHPRLNGNVLIEIGAALALYKSNFVLLVEEGVLLPSNLQGLYECRYKGNELGMEATMKLLKAFNDFK